MNIRKVTKVLKQKMYPDKWYTMTNPYRVGCCDCGLVHKLEFKIGKGGSFKYRVHREVKLTRLARKNKISTSMNNLVLDLSRFTTKMVRITERGELMKFFVDNINVTRAGTGTGMRFPLLTMPRMGKMLKGKTLQQLYKLKSTCVQEAERKKEKYFETFSKTFYWEIKK